MHTIWIFRKPKCSNNDTYICCFYVKGYQPLQLVEKLNNGVILICLWYLLLLCYKTILEGVWMLHMYIHFFKKIDKSICSFVWTCVEYYLHYFYHKLGYFSPNKFFCSRIFCLCDPWQNMTIEQLILELINMNVFYSMFNMFQSFSLGSYQWNEYKKIFWWFHCYDLWIVMCT